MKKLELFGVETELLEQIKLSIQQFLEGHNIQLDLTNITSTSKLIDLNVTAIPALKYGSAIITFQDKDNIESSIKPIFNAIKKDFNVTTCMNCSNCNCKNNKNDRLS